MVTTHKKKEKRWNSIMFTTSSLLLLTTVHIFLGTKEHLLDWSSVCSTVLFSSSESSCIFNLIIL